MRMVTMQINSCCIGGTGTSPPILARHDRHAFYRQVFGENPGIKNNDECIAAIAARARAVRANTAAATAAAEAEVVAAGAGAADDFE